ncbi:hypothetical protein C0J52_07243 [Blattella germanica]|nr:hypothetical protein C0J52_07243 [Blattella germanica]
MFLFLHIFLLASGICDRIEQKFLMSGQSFSTSDRDFALIEKNVQNVLKYKQWRMLTQ